MNKFISTQSGSVFGGKKLAIVLLLALFMFLSVPVHAADFYLPQDKNDANVVIGSGENYSDLYTAAGNLTLNSGIKGDLTAVGGTVSFDGAIEKSLLLAGGNMTLGGTVGETARIVGGNYSVSSKIGGDLALAGGNVTITDKAVINKDLLAAAGNLILNGEVRGKARIAGGTVYINGKILGDVRIRAGQKVTFGPKADIQGKVTYYAPEAATFISGSNVKNTEFKLVEKRTYKNEVKAFLSFALLVKLLAWFLAGLLALRLFKQKIQEIFAEITQKPWSNLGMGLVWFILTPIVVILLFVSMIGYYLGGVLLFTYILGLFFANLLSALMLGYLIAKYLHKSEGGFADWQLVTVGVVALTVLKFIPIVGWVAAAVLFLVSLGAMAQIIKKQLSN